RFTFTGVARAPMLSLNRGFSAPIKTIASQSSDDLRFLAAHDTDPFNRWQAVQTLATGLLIDNVAARRAAREPRQDDGLIAALAADQYRSADNMTDRMAAISTLSLHDVPERSAALEDFYRRFQDDPLVIDKWFSLQAMIPEPATLPRVKALTAHPAFSFANPN